MAETTRAQRGPAPGTAPVGRPGAHRPARHRLGPALVLLSGLLLAAICASLAIGAGHTSVPEVWRVLTGTSTDPTVTALVTDYRIPRTCIGLAVGAALGASGALIQAYTRNPLADPGILGVNAGSTFAVAVCLSTGLLVSQSVSALVVPSLLGALAATVAVIALASAGKGPATPIRMTLTGVALAAVLNGLTTAMRLTDPATFDTLLSWMAGSLASRGLDDLLVLLPLFALGLLLALSLIRSLNALALGEDTAMGLGVNTRVVRWGTVVTVALLVGTATALAGPISFLGLMVPHAVRLLVGNDQARIIPSSMLAAPVVLLASDVLARVLLPMRELPVGVVTAFLGGPVLIWLIRSRKVDTQ